MGICTAWAEPAASLKFDGPEKSWQLMAGLAPARILAQDFAQGGARDAVRFERVVVAAPVGQSAFLVCPIPPVAVLDELQVRLWVKSLRPDMQLAIRIVLPRSVDAQGRHPTAIVRGTAYSRPGNWQELRLADVPRLFADQVRVMRVTPGASIDPKEAFVDAIVLLVPGNPSGTEVELDDLTVEGVLMPAANGALAAQPIAKPAVAKAVSPNRKGNGTAGQRGVAPVTQPQPVATSNKLVSASKASTVRLQGTTLYVDDRPFLPRVIQSNGEPLQLFATCGFNVVQLPSAPTPEQSAEAERLGIWFLCTPAKPDALARTGLGRVGDRVIAWRLQDDALEVDSNYSMRWAEAVRERDAVFGRPVVIMPAVNWAAVNKASDILIARNSRSGPVRPLEFQAWLEACPPKARPGMPLWVAISTQTDETMRRQIGALTHTAAPPLAIDVGELESHVQIACAHSMRGFVFQSTSPLNGVDESTQQRVAALQLVNRRLQLIEPWLAGGKVMTEVHSADWVENGVLLHVDRARLLVPLPNERPPDVKLGAAAVHVSPKEVSFVVPSVPETSQVFYFSPTSMRTLESQRIAGGTKFSIPAAGGGYVVMTEDPQVIQSLQQRVTRDGGKTVRLERDLAARRARVVAYGSQRLTQVGFNAEAIAREAAVINQQLVLVDSHLAAGRAEQAHDAITLLMKEIDRSTAEQRLAIAPPTLLESNPLAVFSDTLPEYAALERALGTLRPGENSLVGGDFENLNQMTQLGWQHLETAPANVTTSAQLSSVAPQQGTYCLELSATAVSGETGTLSSKVVSIVSPEVPVDPSKMIEISGWVRIDEPFVGGDGLEISDSLGGPGLALTASQTSGWQPFRMIRAATDSTPMRITFSLTGLGRAKVDAVMVRTMSQPVARRLPPAGSTGTATATKTSVPGGGGGPGLLAPPTR